MITLVSGTVTQDGANPASLIFTSRSSIVMLWIPITIAAAFVQNLRFMLQKQVKAHLSSEGATFARFVFAAPFAILLVLALLAFTSRELPEFTTKFWVYAGLGGIAQIIATVFLVALFSFRNFAVGVALSKTEVVQTALIGMIVLSEVVSFPALMGILISLVGVLFISGESLTWRLTEMSWRPTLLGVGSGALFGLSAVSYRGASLSLAQGDFLIRAAVTLACVTVLQTLMMAIWLAWRQRGQMAKVFAHWRVTLWIGVTGMLGSLGWFTAMTLQNAAYVRALGQVELVFTLAASWFFFKERITGSEFLGIALLVGGIVLLLLGG